MMNSQPVLFYLDDCLKSVETEDNAKSLISSLRHACSNGGFNLTKFTCNNSNVIKSIPEQHHSKEIQSRDLNYDKLPVEHTLGMKWCAETDTLGFSVVLKPKPWTRRGILSVVSSLYDPLGLVAPFLLTSKLLLQDLCKKKDLDWDDEIPSDYKTRWNKWLNEIPVLEGISLKRCVKPKEFGDVISSQIHVFSDACKTGYGVAAYLRLCDKNGKIYCTLMMGKSRVAPLKTTTIPRLELTAATVSVHIGQLLKKEHDLDIDRIMYYTDSTTVLHYISSENRRFPVFVANSVQKIREYSDPVQWHYIDTKDNPADDASRGLFGGQVQTERSHWFNGPEFLWKPESEWFQYGINKQDGSITQNWDEVDILLTTTANSQNSHATMEKLLHHFSDWFRLKKATVVLLRFQRYLHDKLHKNDSVGQYNLIINVQDIECAELAILRYIQSVKFNTELWVLEHTEGDSNLAGKRGRVKVSGISKSSAIYRLDPFVDNKLLRVGGRLSKASIPEEAKHPVLLPYNNHVTTLIIRDIHERLGHAGRNHVLAALREKYWVIKANSAVRHVITNCVKCRRFRTPVAEQKMSDLPPDRVNPAPPFTYCGVDYFGPFLIKEGRKELKRYGVLFTCLVSRAIHIETANSLETDSFILALRRFIARRGPIQELRSDNGSNFVGAERELRLAISEIHNSRIHNELLAKNIDWKFNTPTASHTGGVWERQIRTVRRTLAYLLKEFGVRLDDESYRTLVCEVEAIVNSRPLTFASPDDLNPLSPNNLLTMKTTVILPPPGQFQHEDVYMRKRWRRVQYLANIFWSRWKREYLCTLQERQKWNHPKQNFQTGDIVLIKDENTPRNNWKMGRILEVKPDKHGLVRSVLIKTQSSEFLRPVNKVVLLLAVEVQ